MKIKQVDKADEDKKEIYSDLEYNESFVWADDTEEELYRVTESGYLQESTGEFPSDSDYESRRVITVDSEILWKYKQ